MLIQTLSIPLRMICLLKLDNNLLLHRFENHLSILMEMRSTILSLWHMEHSHFVHLSTIHLHRIQSLILGSNLHLHYCTVHLGIQLEEQTFVRFLHIFHIHHFHIQLRKLLALMWQHSFQIHQNRNLIGSEEIMELELE